MIKQKTFKAPILFVIFRRKDTALQVIDAISKVRPEKLYISQDGPRNKNEEKEILDVRKAVLSKINWKCQLTVWSHGKNLGLKKHIPEAFDKFFKKEEYGIYLEDDTLPSDEFFYFEKALLEKYKNNKNIFSINGTNFYPESIKSKDSYYLSKLGDIWGFGLWKRSWELYDSEMKDFESLSKSDKYKSYFFSLRYKFYLESFWKAIINGKIDSWAMQLIHAAVKNDMYFITPKFNMVNNIGVNSGSNISLQKYFKNFENLFPIKYPRRLIYDKTLDEKYFSRMLRGGWFRIILIKLYLSFPKKTKVAISKLINKI